MDLKEHKHVEKTYSKIPIPLAGEQAFLFEENVTQSWNSDNPGLETLQDIADALGYGGEIKLEGDFLDIESKDYREFMKLAMRINELRTGTLEVRTPEEIDPVKKKFYEDFGDGIEVMTESEVYKAVKSQFGEAAHQTIRDMFALREYTFNDNDRVIEVATLKPLYVPGLRDYTFIDVVKKRKNFQTDNPGLETLEDIASSKKYEVQINLEGDFLDVNHPAYLDFMNLILNVENASRSIRNMGLDGYARMIEACDQLKTKHGDGAYKTVTAIYQITDKTLAKAQEVLDLAEKHNVVSISCCTKGSFDLAKN